MSDCTMSSASEISDSGASFLIDEVPSKRQRTEDVPDAESAKQEHFYDAASNTGYISCCLKQFKVRFVEHLLCHRLALMMFLQEAQISKGPFMLNDSLMGLLVEKPCLFSTTLQTIP
ncbi:hypothetical protein NFI96_017133 [Prochilodus magdalenae]|nr:hypothetical protein NFI96_017133 [Prochilodus magdalenae]